MGAAAIVGEQSGASVLLKNLPEAIEETIFLHEKWALIIDPSEQAARFLKYQSGSYINYDDSSYTISASSSKKRLEALKLALVASMKQGRTMTLKFDSFKGLDASSVFSEKMFPQSIISRRAFLASEDWKKLQDPSDKDELEISSEFVFIIVVTSAEEIPTELLSCMHIIKVVEAVSSKEIDGTGSGDSNLDQVALLYGANEIVRNSIAMVEAAFDNELELVKDYLNKGYHIESKDGRKHTALSESAAQGHLALVTFLLSNGADPNALSDTGRSPLWRAAFNNHLVIVNTLLEAGSDPSFRDRISMEGPYDVATSEDVRSALSSWDAARTVTLMENRKRIMRENLEARIKTTAEREAFARNLIRQELIEKANNGDIVGIKFIIEQIVAELSKASQRQGPEANCRPRATVEVRNDQGQSLLSIAAQRDDDKLAAFILSHWKTIDKDRWDLAEGESSAEARVFKPNVNSRDLKGWTIVCIAVFHESSKVLKLLLESGGDPNIRSTYNKNAWDLAKDELDAAGKVITSKALIRQILIGYDQSSTSEGMTRVFGDGAKGAKRDNDDSQIYEGLGEEGSPIVMQIEMRKGVKGNEEKAGKKNGKGIGGIKKRANGGERGKEKKN